MKKKAAHAIRDILPQVLEKLDEKKKITEDELLEVWCDAVGKAGSDHTHPVSLRNRTLKVVVENPGWNQILTMKKRQVIKKLQSRFGKDKISDIQFRVGKVR